MDADEVEGLIKSIEIIQAKIFTSTPDNYTEVSYYSRDGFSAGCFWSKYKWSTYIKLEKYDSDSYVFLKENDFPRFLELLRLAEANLK